jgi:hypothetical protein
VAQKPADNANRAFGQFDFVVLSFWLEPLSPGPFLRFAFPYLMTISEKLIICALATASTVAMSGCGGTSTTRVPLPSTNVAIKFRAIAPTVLAEKIGNGAWAAASAQGSQLNLTLPAGVSNYAIAYVCLQSNQLLSLNNETVIEATTQDAIPILFGCVPISGTGPVNKGSVTGSVDATAISGVVQIQINAPLGLAILSGSSGTFDFQAEQGVRDIAFTALDISNNVVAVKIVPSQTIPGPVNNGNVVTFSAADATTSEPLSVTNVPSGSGFTGTFANYVTANNTSFTVGGLGLAGQYSVVPPADVQTGDRYDFSASFIGPQFFVSDRLTATSATPISLALPTHIPTGSPSPAAFPNIPVASSGTQAGTTNYSVGLQWVSQNTFTLISVGATPNYLAGASSLSVPDLTGISGFIPAVSTGTLVNWSATVSGSTTQSSGNVSRWFEINSGTYTEP